MSVVMSVVISTFSGPSRRVGVALSAGREGTVAIGNPGGVVRLRMPHEQQRAHAQAP